VCHWLNQINIPARSFFAGKELRNPDAIEAFTLLTLLANPNDYVALRGWCGHGSTDKRYKSWKRLWNYCLNNDETPLATLEHLVDNRIRIPYTNSLVKRFQCFQKHLEKLEQLRGNELLDSLFPENQEWSLPLRDMAKHLDQDDFDAKILHERLHTKIVRPEIPLLVDYIRVMSLHKSKGLTADLVVVVGCNEGFIPNNPPANSTHLEQSAFLEEQRRLFYVAITRTTKSLILSSINQLAQGLTRQMGVVSNNQSNHVNPLPSTFLNELGPSRPDIHSGSDFLRECGISHT